jgi:energy-coupling factor transport system permease protein
MAFFNDISLGQYYPCNSYIHRLDPRTKLAAMMLVMTSLLLAHKLAALCVFATLLLVTIALSRIPWQFVFRNLRPFVWLFGLTLLFHVFWTPGRIITRIPVIGIEITYEGLVMGTTYSIRLGLLIIFAAILTLTTSPIEMTDAMEKLFAPLKRLRLPTHEIVMMLTLSLRFIPTLMEEAQRLKNAQISRGATFGGSMLQRIRSIIPLVLPLFISAFRRADELAMAMDSRCYVGGEGRTSYTRLKFKQADYFILIFSVSLLCGSILI